VVEQVPNWRWAGQAVAAAELVDCRRCRTADAEEAHVRWHDGLFAWVLASVRVLEPFEVKGRPGAFRVNVEERRLCPQITQITQMKTNEENC